MREWRGVVLLLGLMRPAQGLSSTPVTGPGDRYRAFGFDSRSLQRKTTPGNQWHQQLSYWLTGKRPPKLYLVRVPIPLTWEDVGRPVVVPLSGRCASTAVRIMQGYDATKPGSRPAGVEDVNPAPEYQWLKTAISRKPGKTSEGEISGIPVRPGPLRWCRCGNGTGQQLGLGDCMIHEGEPFGRRLGETYNMEVESASGPQVIITETGFHGVGESLRPTTRQVRPDSPGGEAPRKAYQTVLPHWEAGKSTSPPSRGQPSYRDVLKKLEESIALQCAPLCPLDVENRTARASQGATMSNSTPDPFYSSPFGPFYRRHAPYMVQPEYRIYEMNKRLQTRTEVSRPREERCRGAGGRG
ncbi:LIM domain-binding protein 2 [Liparis tanakae]|uniref:LIM domain-binding protein 2 n=1 Tax=Liparis tanakae TaxID=230148 RepID=A0A4Z2FQF6_9TELE|nr:LIM domain-binding protein 2 [Liparis tanakae]